MMNKTAGVVFVCTLVGVCILFFLRENVTVVEIENHVTEYYEEKKESECDDCMICGADASKRVLVGGVHKDFTGMTAARCKICGHTALCKMPSEEYFNNYYKRDYAANFNRHPKKIEFPKNGIFITRARRHWDYLKPFISSKTLLSVLDLGCGRSEFNHASPYTLEFYYCIELDIEMAAAVNVTIQNQKNAVVDTKPFNPDAFQDETFNVFHCSHVMEHLRDPVKLLFSLKRILAPGSLLLIEVPDITNGEWDKASKGLSHNHFFTSNSFRVAHEQAGYTILSSYQGSRVLTIVSKVL